MAIDVVSIGKLLVEYCLILLSNTVYRPLGVLLQVLRPQPFRAVGLTTNETQTPLRKCPVRYACVSENLALPGLILIRFGS